MDSVTIDSYGLWVDDVDEFAKSIQKHIKEGVIEVYKINEDKSVTTYAIYEDSIKEIITERNNNG